MTPTRILCALSGSMLIAGSAACLPLALQPLRNTAKTYDLRLDVSAADYPKDDVVVLLDRVEKRIQNTGNVEVEVHRVFKVLRGRGEGVSSQRILAPPDNRLELVAQTITATGERITVPGSDIHRERVKSQDPLDSASDLVSFAFSAIEAGAILEYRYTMYDNRPFIADVHLFDGPHPIQVAQFVLGLPSGRSFQVYPEQGRAATKIRSRVTQSADLNGQPVRTETYELRDVPAIPAEPHSLLELKQRSHLLLMSGSASGARETQKVWNDLATNLMRVQTGPRYDFEYPRAMAIRLAKESPRPVDKAMAVAQDLSRRLQIERTHRVSETPRTLDEVFKSGIAEPLEFGRILVAMFRSLGLPAYFGLVNSANNLALDERVPWLGFFDRWLIYVQTGERSLYFDLESPDILSGMPRYDCQGRKMLISKPNVKSGATEASLVEVARVDGAVSTIDRQVRALLQGDGTTRLIVEENVAGEIAWALARRVRADGMTAARDAVAARLFAGVADVHADAITLAFNSDHSAVVRVDVETAVMALQTSSGRLFLPGVIALAPEFLQLATTDLSRRVLGVDLGSPFHLRTTVTVELAPGAKIAALPAAHRVEALGLSFELKSKSQRSGLEISYDLNVLRSQFSSSEVVALDEFLRSAIDMSTQGVLIASVAAN